MKNLHLIKENNLIRRFIGFLSRLSGRSASVVLPADSLPLHRIQTELSGEVMLHAGDIIHVERSGPGFCVYASVLREYDLYCWPLYSTHKLRPAEDFRIKLENKLASSVVILSPKVHEEAPR